MISAVRSERFDQATERGIRRGDMALATGKCA
jgi:hypothetical protein